jgi:hypothetical protein
MKRVDTQEIEKMREKCGELVSQYMKRYNIRFLTGFVKALNEVLRPHGNLTLEAVRRWRSGLNTPDYWMMLYIFNNTSNGDWRNLFAGDVLAVLRPDLWD